MTTQAPNAGFTFQRRPTVDSGNVDIVGGIQPINLGARPEDVIQDIVTDDVRLNADAIAFEKFMHERVVITLSPPPGEHEPFFAEVTVNGQYMRIPRDGEPHTVPRYVLSALANAKGMRLKQDKTVDSTGAMAFREKMVMSYTFPFSVVTDPNPQGGKWLMSLMRSPA